MRLHTSLTSPFGRKVRLAVRCAGLAAGVQLLVVNLAEERARVFALNPLGKIPVLQLPDGRCLHDSRVIVDYLDLLAANAVLLPREPAQRLEVLCEQSLADGLLDATVLQVYEARYREASQRSDLWLAMQREKVAHTLTHLQERVADRPLGAAPHIGEITLAVALAFLGERISQDWRHTHPRLADWLDRFAVACPDFGATAPPS